MTIKTARMRCPFVLVLVFANSPIKRQRQRAFFKQKGGEKDMRVFKRGKSWYVDYRVNDKRIMKSFGRQKAMADLYAKDLELKEARGELGLVEQKITLQAFIQKYIDYCRINKSTSTYITDENRLKRFRDFVETEGINKLRDVDHAFMERFKANILQTASPSTFNHYLVLIKGLLNKAVQWQFLRSNPLAGFKKMQNDSAKQIRYLTADEISEILNQADPLMERVVKIALLTGIRRSELAFLEWSDIDFKNKLITIQAKPEQGFHPKSYKPRSMPMSSELEKLLLDIPQLGRFVFDTGSGQPLYEPGTYSKKFIQILRQVGIKNASLHTLRHTFASNLVMSEVDLRTVQGLLGHSSVSITEKYSHLSPSHIRKAVELLHFGNKMETNSTFQNPSR